jgi:hypothetical protein
LETIFERVAGLDVHKAQVTACVRVPGPSRGREQHLAEFSTTVRGLVALRDWLEAHEVTDVAMEATGVYWQPVWHVLEDAFELMLGFCPIFCVRSRATDPACAGKGRHDHQDAAVLAVRFVA